MLVFYDFEVFKYDWLVVLHEIPSGTRTQICNDRKSLVEFYERHKEDIWVGFNSKNYDQWILRAIVGGFNPYEMSEWIIAKDKTGYSFNRALNGLKLYNYDVFGGPTDYSLKTLEGFMGHDIKETSVDFGIGRKLTDEEISETFKYCNHDVDELMEVFVIRKDEFETQIATIKEFGLPLDCINKSTAQLIAIILKAEKKRFDDEYELSLPPTLKLSRYKYVADWFMSAREDAKNELEEDYKNAKESIKIGIGRGKSISEIRKLVEDYEFEYDKTFASYYYRRSLTANVAGIEHVFAWGGVHAAIPKFNYECKEDEIMIMSDVTSLYPSLHIRYDLQSRAVKDRSIFKHIYDQNVELKKRKDPRRPIYKRMCNIAYGAEGDKYNPLYDRRNQRLTCVYGQLLILDLIEKLEPHIKLIQSNTDGILFLIKKKDFQLIDDIVYEWESRTGLSMEFTYAKKIHQGDVNNYVMVETNGNYKSKGAYVKELSKLDYDLPIVNEAIVRYMVDGIPVEKTIVECNELIKFQKIVKLSSKYEYVTHNGKRYGWKSYRVFASKDYFRDGPILKWRGGKGDKFANTPENCFIDNGDVTEKQVPEKLDRNYYIELARQRLKEKFDL